MLSDEEKKAVDELKKEINNPVEVPTDKFNTFILYNIESARTILNLIEKQSKEIEELNKSDESKEQSSMKYYNLYKELVDKIKAKIEEVDIQLQKLKDGLTGRKTNFANKNMLFAQKKVLQSLLEKED